MIQDLNVHPFSFVTVGHLLVVPAEGLSDKKTNLLLIGHMLIFGSVPPRAASESSFTHL